MQNPSSTEEEMCCGLHKIIRSFSRSIPTNTHRFRLSTIDGRDPFGLLFCNSRWMVALPACHLTWCTIVVVSPSAETWHPSIPLFFLFWATQKKKTCAQNNFPPISAPFSTLQSMKRTEHARHRRTAHVAARVALKGLRSQRQHAWGSFRLLTP